MPPFESMFDHPDRPSPRAAGLTRLSRLALMALASTLCAACAPWSTPTAVPQASAQPTAAQPAASAPSTASRPAPTQAEVDRTWAAIQDRIASTPPEQWPAHAAALGDGRASPEQSVELALLLGLMHTDITRALDLLQGVLQRPEPESQAWQRTAWLLQALLSEQRRQQEQLDRVNTQLRDQQRDSQRRIDQLNEKLEALKSIERSLNQRATPPAAAPRP